MSKKRTTRVGVPSGPSATVGRYDCEESEQQIFERLGTLCVSPGYIHALALICLNDNVVGFDEALSGNDLLKMHHPGRLIRTELLTILGLMVKAPVNFDLPEPATIKKYVDETYRLMQALHQAMVGPILGSLSLDKLTNASFNPFGSGSALREPIFYSGEPAYSFQLRDLAVPKYVADNNWLKERKCFSIQEARDIVQALLRVQHDKLTSTFGRSDATQPSEHSVLECFTASASEIAQSAGYDIDIVRSVLSAFVVPDGEQNERFQSLHDFNVCTSMPLLKRGIDTFILLSHHSLVHSLYESPFYWMIADPAYKDTAMANRGQFAEKFVYERMASVFGKDRVFHGVKIRDPQRSDLTDIDILVVFGDRAIVVQAKSKKLTLEARRGNDDQIKTDFRKAVQEAYDQGFESATALGNSRYIFRDSIGKLLQIPEVSEVFIVTVLSESYPALAFQSRQFLHTRSAKSIRPPIITDVFSVDAMTEMLDSPLWLLDYIRRRSGYFDKLHVPDELTALAYHLKGNLWLEEGYDMVQLADDISCDLDAAMAVRRDGVPGERTPDGILTKFSGLTIEKLLKEIEAKPDAATLGFAFTVLTCDEKTIRRISNRIDKAAELSTGDGKLHDIMVQISSNPATGVIIHCSPEPTQLAMRRLRAHCEDRKYLHKCERWFGICVEPYMRQLRFGVGLEFPWRRDPVVEQRASALVNHQRSKVGRNAPCPCGSGKKYKKCHLR